MPDAYDLYMSSPRTYEGRYQMFCRVWMLDPEDPESVHIYETAWEEDYAADQDSP